MLLPAEAGRSLSSTRYRRVAKFCCPPCALPQATQHTAYEAAGSWQCDLYTALSLEHIPAFQVGAYEAARSWQCASKTALQPEAHPFILVRPHKEAQWHAKSMLAP